MWQDRKRESICEPRYARFPALVICPNLKENAAP
jgi:hypothetical protein